MAASSEHGFVRHVARAGGLRSPRLPSHDDPARGRAVARRDHRQDPGRGGAGAVSLCVPRRVHPLPADPRCRLVLPLSRFRADRPRRRANERGVPALPALDDGHRSPGGTLPGRARTPAHRSRLRRRLASGRLRRDGDGGLRRRRIGDLAGLRAPSHAGAPGRTYSDACHDRCRDDRLHGPFGADQFHGRGGVP